MTKLNPEDPIVRAAVFGKQVEDWLNNDPIGKFLIERADKEIAELSIDLRHANPDTKAGILKIKKLQNRIAICESVLTWLGEAVTEGHQTMQILEDQHER